MFFFERSMQLFIEHPHSSMSAVRSDISCWNLKHCILEKSTSILIYDDFLGNKRNSDVAINNHIHISYCEQSPIRQVYLFGFLCPS